MKKKILLFTIMLLNIIFINIVKAEEIEYKSHVSNIGWQDYVNDGEVSGTTGKSEKIEAFIINKIDFTTSGDIQYSSYVEGIGWQDYVSSSSISGTTGQNRRIEMIKIKLTEELAEEYDIYYRVHVSNIGWLDWAKNDEITGTLGYNYSIEALQVKLIKKGNEVPTNTTNIYKEKELEIQYKAHVSNIGWQQNVSNGKIAGTTGKSQKIEAYIIDKSLSTIKGEIQYNSYVEGIGWQDYVSTGSISGTTGQNKRIEMVKIKLTEELADNYDIYYRVHVSNIGWLDWAKNDEMTGTLGYNYSIEALQVKLIKKGDEVPANTTNIYIEKEINIEYQSYFNNKWQDIVKNGETTGTMGKSTNIVKYKISINNNSLNNWVQYSSYVSGKGWQNYVSNNNSSGGANSKDIIEMIKIKLSDEAIQNFDIYYRVHISNIGWLDWAKNGEITGTKGYNYGIEAIEIKILKKGDNTIECGNDIYRENQNYLTYTTHIQDYGWIDSSYDNEINGKIGFGKRMEAIKISINNPTVSGNIKYSTHIQEYGWLDYVYDNEIGGTIGKSKRMEAIKIELTGELSQLYDIYYRTYVEDYGWLDWAKNGEISGSISISKRIEAIQITIVNKGADAPGNTEQSYLNSIWRIIDGQTYYFEDGYKVIGFKVINGTKYFFNSDGVLIGSNVEKIIDVSKFQSTIDWASVKNDGVDGAIIRLGYGTSYSTDECYFDPTFERNYYGTTALGMLTGIYLYSYAIDSVSATIEANFVLNKLKEYNVDKSIIIYYDLEENPWTTNLNLIEYHNIVDTFSNIIESNGYTVNVYSYLYWANNRLDAYVRNKLTWIAHYNNICLYEGTYNMWQYTSNGRVSGINDDVDISVKFN